MSGREKLTDWIRVYDNAMPDQLCDELIKWSEDPSTNKGYHNEAWRRCQEVGGVDFTSHWEPVKNIFSDFYHRYRNEISSGILSRANAIEAPNIFRYDVNPERPNVFNSHADNWESSTASRQVSIILYLNDVAEGGATSFDDLNLAVSPKKGRLLFFPSFYTYMHQGKAPISNAKHIMVSWVHYDAPSHSYRTHKF